MSRLAAIVGPLHGEDAESVFDALCVGCVRELDVTGAGLALIVDGSSHGAFGVSGDVSRVLEELQFTLGEGPCLDAYRSGKVVAEPHLATATARWPAFGPEAVDAGVQAVFALPLQLNGVSYGALDLFRDAPGSLSDDQLADAQDAADAATSLLLALQDNAAPGSMPRALEAMAEYRAVVHQAAGMVLVQLGVGIHDALTALRAHAFFTGRPVGEVSESIVSGRLKLNES